MTESPRRCPVVAGCWSIGGEVVARCGDGIAQKRTGWPSFLSSWLLVRWWRSGERLAMVWTVRTSDGAEGEARNWRRCRRHPSPWSSTFLFFLLCPTITT